MSILGNLEGRLQQQHVARFCATALLSLLLLLAGCAKRSSDIVARCGPQPVMTGASRIALLPTAQPRPEDLVLQKVVVAELERNGHRIVPQAEADYTMTCYVEENFVTRLQASTPMLNHTSMPGSPGTGVYLVQPTESFPGLNPEERLPRVEKIPRQGIRLRFYSGPSLRAGRFETTWEGYIEDGFTLRPERQPILVKTLLSYYGRDFIGRVKLVE